MHLEMYKMQQSYSQNDISNNGWFVRKQICSRHRTFLKVGVDYAGQFFTKMKNSRGIKLIKCFECTFVCMDTKVIHLGLENDFTRNAFLAVSQRFSSKLGMHQEIHNDRGFNFLGADKILRKIL